MNYSLALDAGSAKNDLAIGLKPLLRYSYLIEKLLLLAKFVFVVEQHERVNNLIHNDACIFSSLVG
jgi:hypothetical protein